MAQKFISTRNLKLLLYEVFDVEALTRHDYFKAHNRKMFDLVLDAAYKIGTKLLFPTFEEMDRQAPRLEGGRGHDRLLPRLRSRLRRELPHRSSLQRRERLRAAGPPAIRDR